MKKLVFAMLAMVAMSFAACGNKAASCEVVDAADSVAVDTVVVDSLSADSAVVDTVAVDTVAE